MANKLFEFWNVRETRFHLISVTLIIILTAIVYANTLDNEFTNWDDDKLILGNTLIRSLEFDNLKKIFDLKPGGTYQPMRVLSYALDYRIGKFDPFVYHLHNIILHIFSSILLYVLLLTILPRIERGSFGNKVFFARLPDLMRILALFTALLFALHPVNVEAVTWLSSRKYVLLSIFSFASLFCYMQRPVSKKIDCIFYMLSFIFWILAAMSSPFGVILPALFVLLEYCTHPDKNPLHCIKDNLLRFSLYLVLGLVVLAYLLTTLGAASRIESSSVPIFKTMMQVFWDYMRNFVSPFWLNARYVDYVYPSIFSYYKVIAGFSLLLGAVAVSIYSIVKKNDKLFFFALFWFVICWLPASNIVPISTKMADRYIYLGSVGFFVLFSWLVCYLFNSLPKILKAVEGREMMLFISFISLIVIFISILSIIRNDIWQNSGTLWMDSLQKDTGNPIAWNNLGAYSFAKGNVRKSEYCFNRAIEIDPNGIKQYENLGYLFLNQRRLKEASAVYEKLIDLDEASFLGNAALGEIYILLGKPELAFKYIDKISHMLPSDPKVVTQKGNLLFTLGSENKALILYEKALVLYPDSAEIHFNKGLCYQKLGQDNTAVDAFLKALELRPNYAESFNSVGEIYLKQGNLKKAEVNFKKAISNHAGFYSAYNNLGNLYVKQNRFDDALEEYNRALDVRPGFKNTLYNKCVVMKTLGSFAKAEVCYKNILEKYPEHAESKNNLGSLYAEIGQYESAVKMFRNALKDKADFFDANFNLAKIMSFSGSFDEAVLHYEKVLTYQPENNDALNGIAFAYDALGKIDLAILSFMKLLKLNPAQSSIYFNIGILLGKKGQTDDAVFYLKKAVALDPDNKMAKRILEQAKPIKK